jgi:hypothetical protein
MRKDLVVLKTRISWNSFGDYGKNLEKLLDKKNKKQKRKSGALMEEAMTSLDNQYLW